MEILVKEILPRLTKQNSNIKLLVSGSKKIPFNDKNLINVGFVKKNKFYELMKGASLFVNTMKTGYGSQLKTITALSFGKTIIATNKAISGIEINSNFKNLYITDDKKKFASLILKKINSKKINFKSSKYYSKKYSIKNITISFLRENLR